MEVLGTSRDLGDWKTLLGTIDGSLPLTTAANSKICYYFDVAQTCSADAIGPLLSQATWVPTSARRTTNLRGKSGKQCLQRGNCLCSHSKRDWLRSAGPVLGTAPGISSANRRSCDLCDSTKQHNRLDYCALWWSEFGLRQRDYSQARLCRRTVTLMPTLVVRAQATVVQLMKHLLLPKQP